jgi:hypothetical protein
VIALERAFQLARSGELKAKSDGPIARIRAEKSRQEAGAIAPQHTESNKQVVLSARIIYQPGTCQISRSFTIALHSNPFAD